jgi:hypothetical protein
MRSVRQIEEMKERTALVTRCEIYGVRNASSAVVGIVEEGHGAGTTLLEAGGGCESSGNKGGGDERLHVEKGTSGIFGMLIEVEVLIKR